MRLYRRSIDCHWRESLLLPNPVTGAGILLPRLHSASLRCPSAYKPAALFCSSSLQRWPFFLLFFLGTLKAASSSSELRQSLTNQDSKSS